METREKPGEGMHISLTFCLFHQDSFNITWNCKSDMNSLGFTHSVNI